MGVDHPALGRPLSADTVVPSPGDWYAWRLPARSIVAQRYSYVSNNPLKFVDPSGHDACAADDRACWEDEWYWKDRWYKEHGYENTGERYVYTGNYVIDNAVALLRDDDLRRRKILGFARDLADNGTTAGEALARVTAYAAAFYKSVGAAINPYSTPQYVNDVSHVLNGMAGVDIVLDLLRETKKTDPYFVGEDKFPDTDLKAIFQDGTGNQPYHFWFYVAASFWNGPDAAQAGNLFHELVPPQQGRSFQDLALGAMVLIWDNSLGQG